MAAVAIGGGPSAAVAEAVEAAAATEAGPCEVPEGEAVAAAAAEADGAAS